MFYTSLVISVVRDLAWSLLCISGVVVAIYGYIAATAGAGRRKGRARLIAALAFISWLLVTPLLWTLYDALLPVYEWNGVIRSVQIKDSSSQRYNAQLLIADGHGGEVSVHASDRSNAWRPGQRLRVRYRGVSGDLIRATLIGPDGREQGVVNSTKPIERSIGIGLGLLLLWVVLKRYRLDPEGVLEGPHEPSNLSNVVDQDSLLHLPEMDSDGNHKASWTRRN